MTPPDRRRLRELLDRLTPDERLACLICCTMDRECGALRPLASIVSVLSVLASHLSQHDAIALSEIMRDAADHIERWREIVPIEWRGESAIGGARAQPSKTRLVIALSSAKRRLRRQRQRHPPTIMRDHQGQDEKVAGPGTYSLGV